MFQWAGTDSRALAQDGHKVTGIEIASAMNAPALERIARFGSDMRDRATLEVQDALDRGRGYGVESLRFDEEREVLHMKDTWFTRSPDGSERYIEYLGSKHPVSAKGVGCWLKKYDFQLLQMFGDRQGNPYTRESVRAIFWARKV